MKEWCNSLCLCYVFIKFVSFISCYVLESKAIRHFPLFSCLCLSLAMADLCYRSTSLSPSSSSGPITSSLSKGAASVVFIFESLPISSRVIHVGNMCPIEDGPGKSSEEKFMWQVGGTEWFVVKEGSCFATLTNEMSNHPPSIGTTTRFPVKYGYPDLKKKDSWSLHAATLHWPLQHRQPCWY